MSARRYALYAFGGLGADLASIMVDLGSVYQDYQAFTDLAGGSEEFVEVGAISTGIDLGANIVGLVADTNSAESDWNS